MSETGSKGARSRLAIDTGGTFTDLVLAAGDGARLITKAPTTAANPVEGMLAAIDIAAEQAGETRQSLLAGVELVTHATTHFLNAVITGSAARTALLTTAGHPDILVYGEGGRTDIFDHTAVPMPPYIPRALTLEVDERIGAGGEVVQPLELERLTAGLRRLAEQQIEALAVCLLFSPVNPQHELAVGELIEAVLPGVPYTLSHRLNPVLREYRRASSTAIDASLKPLAERYLSTLADTLEQNGFAGKLLIVTSAGGIVTPETIRAAPVHAINSGPSMAPVAAVAAATAAGLDCTSAIVSDAGGTTFDVSVIRDGRISRTRELFLARCHASPMLGLPSLDIRSVGAGGGSIAHVDAAGMLHVGPQSAGADPGPACYGQGGPEPTITDAALLLGYLRPELFLGGRMRVRPELAEQALRERVAEPLGLGVAQAAEAVIALATEQMCLPIEELALQQGIAPQTALLIAGGGAGGLLAVRVARKLGCPAVFLPPAAAVMCAAGALDSELLAERSAALPVVSSDFDEAAVRATLARLERETTELLDATGAEGETTLHYFAEARYPQQAWELELPLPAADAPATALVEAFHTLHEDVFAFADRDAAVEFSVWHARARRRHRQQPSERGIYAEAGTEGTAAASDRESAWPLYPLDRFVPGDTISGPGILVSSYSTVVLDPPCTARRTPGGGILIEVARR